MPSVGAPQYTAPEMLEDEIDRADIGRAFAAGLEDLERAELDAIDDVELQPRDADEVAGEALRIAQAADRPQRVAAQVLDVAGFAQDAFDVAMAGDDPVTADETAHAAFKKFVGSTNKRVRSVAAEDIRYTMVALAAGLDLDDLRWRVSPTLFSFLQANADKLEAGKARTVLSEHFDIDEAEFVEETFGPAVHGASLINFPRTLKPRDVVKKFHPFSSHSIR